MDIIHTLPLLIRSENRDEDISLAFECLKSLSTSRDHHVVIYNQGSLSFEEVDSLVLSSGVSADILGNGNNDGIMFARQACFNHIEQRYPSVPFISEIHNDMLFPPNWYEPLISCLVSLPDEPTICPGILTAYGELQPLGKWIDPPRSLSPEAILQLLDQLPREGALQFGYTHPALYRAELLRELGGYDLRFFPGKQGYEDYSLLLTYAYYIGTRSKWRPKCCLDSWVYHATLSQRMSLPNLNTEIFLNEEGLVRQYGVHGLQQLCHIYGNHPQLLDLRSRYAPL